MLHYNPETRKLLGERKEEILQRYFDDNWCVLAYGSPFIPLEVDLIQILTRKDCCEGWFDYAIIEREGSEWRICEQHIEIDECFCEQWGKEYRKWINTEQKAMYVYGTYKNFGAAVRNLAMLGVSDKNRKPLEVYV